MPALQTQRSGVDAPLPLPPDTRHEHDAEQVPGRIQLEPAAATTPRWLRVIRNGLVFSVALFATTWGIRSMAPPPEFPSQIREKLEYFAAHKDEYDVIFIGSSLVQTHLSPAQFDEEMARQGYPVKSYNFGVSAMLDQETDRLLARIYEMKPKRLKHVVCEFYIWEHLRPGPGKVFTPRGLWWLDEEGMSAVCQRILETPIGPHKVYGSLAIRSVQYAARTARVGEGPRIVGTWIGWDDLGERDDFSCLGVEGFTALKTGPNETASQRRTRLAFQEPKPQADFRNMVETMPVAPLDFVGYRPEAVDARSKLAQDHGVEMIYVVAPLANSTPRIGEVECQPNVSCVVKLNDPARYPDLYDMAYRWDVRHLTPEGAARMTHHVVEHIAAHWKTRGGR